MQKFSACRKRGSSIHFFSSTRTRCISAICPAGPPNDRQPILNQTLNASLKFGPSGADAALVMSRYFRRPVVPLLRGKAEVREQRIVDHEAFPQHAAIVI